MNTENAVNNFIAWTEIVQNIDSYQVNKFNIDQSLDIEFLLNCYTWEYIERTVSVMERICLLYTSRCV